MPKQVDGKWLARLDALRPREADFPLPDDGADALAARVPAPAAPWEGCAHASHLDNWRPQNYRRAKTVAGGTPASTVRIWYRSAEPRPSRPSGP